MRSQGRFSGRLSSKEDEERLVAECGRLGPLLGGLPGCDGACDTLSRIVRSIACSDLRRHLEGKERRFRVRLPLYPVTASTMDKPAVVVCICDERRKQSFDQAVIQLRGRSMHVHMTIDLGLRCPLWSATGLMPLRSAP